MKKILLLIALTLLAISTVSALEPLKVAIFKTGGAANVQVVLNDYTGGTASAIYTGPAVSLTPNSSGVIIINIANNTAATDWADITAAQVNSHYILDVLVGGTLYAQYRLDQQIINQSQGGVLDSDGNLTPPEDGGGSIGSDDVRWSDLFVGSNTIHVGPAGGAPLTELAISYNAGTAYLNVDNNNSLSLSPTLLNFNNNLFRVDANSLDYSSGRFKVDATRLDYRSGTFRVDDDGIDYKSGRLRVYDTDFGYKNYFIIDGTNGNTTFNGNTSVSGSKTFTVGSGATILGGTLGVTGATTLTDLSGTGTRNVQVDNTGKLVASTIISSPFTESGNKVYRNDPDDDFIFGDDDFMHDSPVNIDENKFFFDKSKGAFRVGTISNVNWDDANVGVGSFATGKSTLASGEGAIALGPFHDASGQFSVAIGYASYATKKFSFAIGVNANAHGESSYSFGTGSAAMADYSTAIGINSAAVAEYGTAIGIGSKAEGEYSTAIGLWTKAMSYGETVVGTFNTNYTPDNDVAFDVDDRHFVVGNGTADGSRSDALIIYKSGNVEIPSLSSGGTQNLQVDNTGKLVAGGGTVTTNTTINGDGATTALGINLASANTWTGAQTLPATSAQGNALISSINSGTTTINAARVAGGGGGGTLAYTEVTANTTLNTDNRVVYITGAYTVTLPASPATGQILHFYSESATAEIDSQTIEVRDDGNDYTGSAPFSDYTSGLNVSLFYNGSKWLIISK